MLKINGTVIPDGMIKTGSFKTKTLKQVVRSWTDLTGALHEDYYPHSRVKIEFTIRAHSDSFHSSVEALECAQAVIEYTDLATGTVKTLNGAVRDINWNKSQRGFYGDTKVTIEGY